MIAVSISGKKKVRLIQVNKPKLGRGEVLMEVKYVGFCGSDLNTFLGKNPMVILPVIPGHEIGGVVAEVSDGVPDNIEVGMACTVNPYTSCGRCPSCRNRRPNACRFNQTLGVQRNGAMCEYIAVPWEKIITDDELSPFNFALVEPMSVGFHAVSRAGVTDLDTVMVIGCGMIGIGAVIRSTKRGAKVIVVDVDDEKLKLAQKIGADHIINSKSEDVHQKLTELTKGTGPDVIIEAVGATATYQMAINEIAFTGRIVCIGYAKTDIAFETKYFVMKEMDILGSRNSLPEDFRAVINYIRHNKSVVDLFISGIYKPENAHEVLKKWADNPGKVFRILIEF